MPSWVWGATLAALLAGIYLLVSPSSADLAAATYRSDLFARAGFVVWDDGWYAGHALPAYSLIAPALGAWLGVRLLIALSAVAASAVFGVLADRMLGRRAGAARAATLVFAFGFCAELPSGRVPYDLGVAIALGAVAAMTVVGGGGRDDEVGRRRQGLAVALSLALAVVASAASPVAGAFLALASLAFALGHREAAPVGIAVCLAALLPILALTLAFPEGGYEPFAPGAFWPELAAAIAVAALLPQGALSAPAWRTLRIGATLYALALIASFIMHTPMGGNVVRLGAMFGPSPVVGALWSARMQMSFALTRSAARRRSTHATKSDHERSRARGRLIDGRLALLALAPLLLYWQLASAIDDQVALAGDPTVQASFYAPLRAQLLRLAHGRPIRVEVPLTGAHWESAYLPGGPISIARGWERQLDTRYGALFYRRAVASSEYEHWLHANAVAYVALPAARLDSAGQAEARLIEQGLPSLREVWRARRWRLFEVLDATPLAQPPAKMLWIDPESFAIAVPHGGRYEVRLHWSPYWRLSSARGCVSPAKNDFTDVRVSGGGTYRVEIAPALGRIFSESARCDL